MSINDNKKRQVLYSIAHKDTYTTNSRTQNVLCLILISLIKFFHLMLTTNGKTLKLYIIIAVMNTKMLTEITTYMAVILKKY